MPERKINWGILGTSYISQVMAKAIQASSTSQLVAVGSRSLSAAQQFAESFSIPSTYDNFELLLNDEAIDAIYIGLPNQLHKEWIIRCAQAGKHILCEKPFVLSTAEAKEVISILEKTQVYCVEALMYRFHPLIQKLQEVIKSQILGEIHLYNAVYTANIVNIANPVAGGSIRNLGCYPVSLIRLLVEEEPVDIIGLGRMDSNNNSDRQASLLLKFKNKVMATVSTADDLEMNWQFEVYGTRGCLKAISNPWMPDMDNKIVIQLNYEKTSRELNIQADKPLYTYQIDEVNKQIFNNCGKQRKISLTDSLGNIKVLEEWLKQVKIQNSRMNELVDLTF